MKTKDVEDLADKDVSQYGYTSLEVVLLEKISLPTSWTRSQKRRVTLREQAMCATLAPMRI